MRKIIASLDIGSSSIKLVVGEIYRSKLNILACLDTPAQGIKNGFVVNLESATISIKELFDRAEENLGLRPNKVIVNVPANGAEFYLMEGSISLNPEKAITGNDIMACLQACIHKKIPEGQEVVSILPSRFRLNDSDVTLNPLGLKTSKLAAKAVAITVPHNNVMGIVKALEKIGVKVIDIALNALGDFYQFKDRIPVDKVGAVVNIGAAKTEVAIFNKGIMTGCEVIDIGGENIDKDLCYIYKIKKSDAIFIKEKMALADKNQAKVIESTILTNINGEKIKINQYDASEIVMSRLEEILDLIKKQINLLTKKEISYIMIVGGITELGEFKYFVEHLYKNAYVFENTEIGARDGKFTTAVGLIKYYNSRLKLRNKDFSIFSLEEQEELSGYRKININDNSLLGKLFGYFFDN